MDELKDERTAGDDALATGEEVLADNTSLQRLARGEEVAERDQRFEDRRLAAALGATVKLLVRLDRTTTAPAKLTL